MCLLLDYVQGNINIKMELNINTLKTILLEYSWFAVLYFNKFCSQAAKMEAFPTIWQIHKITHVMHHNFKAAVTLKERSELYTHVHWERNPW